MRAYVWKIRSGEEFCYLKMDLSMEIGFARDISSLHWHILRQMSNDFEISIDRHRIEANNYVVIQSIEHLSDRSMSLT